MTPTRTATRILTLLLVLGTLVAPLVAQQTTAPAPPPKQVVGYVIGANDVLRVNVFSGGNSQSEFQLTPYTVQTDGAIVLPLLKPIQVAGKSVAQTNAAIRQALLDNKQFTECTVDVVVLEYHSSNIKVQGAVRNPGTIKMTAERMNISDALNNAGGLQPSAGTQIRVRRAVKKPADPDVVVIDGWEIYAREDLDNGRLSDVQLYDNDTVDVPVAPKFFVNGFVKTPGEYQWEPNLTLERALIKAGGVASDGAKNRISIRRLDPKTKKYEDVKLNKDNMSTIVEADDVIDVPKRRM